MPARAGRVGRWEPQADGTAARVVPDRAAGRTWRVWATATGHVPGAPAGDCLVFDAGDVVRRVWGAPPEWPALSDPALLALVAATPGGPRGPEDPGRTRPARAD